MVDDITECFLPTCHKTVYRESAHIHAGAMFCGKKHVAAYQKQQAQPVQQNGDIRPEYYHTENVYEPFKIIRYYGLNFFAGNALKYLLRAGKKNKDTAIEDLTKARTYLNNEIEELKNEKEK